MRAPSNISPRMRKPPTDRGRTATGRGEARVRRAALAGKAFLWSLGALGEGGPGHMLRIFIDELRASLGQLGCPTLSDLRDVPVRHPGAWRAEDFSARG
ncbi:MAG TPA: alpha-hydroxy-acid oxidizing protein [Stellaceae bacterium]|nr:alpha-hydroxy-acid oxidizing protein [Stellaceae bacterium]